VVNPRLVALPPEKNPGTLWIGGWVDPKGGRRVLEIRNLLDRRSS